MVKCKTVKQYILILRDRAPTANPSLIHDLAKVIVAITRCAGVSFLLKWRVLIDCDRN